MRAVVTGLLVLLSGGSGMGMHHPQSSPTDPKEIHITTDDDNVITFHWATESTTVGAAYALLGTTEIAGWSHLMNTSADRQTFLHYAQSPPLTSGQTYSYSVGNRGDGLSPQYNFTVWGAADSPRRLIFFGDSGNNLIWQQQTVPNITKEVAEGRADGIIHLGDMAYSATAKDGLQADIAANEISLASGGRVPIMTSPGNGDVHCYRPEGLPDWATCMKDYQYRWIMPGWNQTHSLWYSFNYEEVHFLMLDSEAGLWCKQSQNLTAQLEFAEEDLAAAAAARDVRPWIVVGIHRPLYSSFNSTGEQQAMRDQYFALFEKYNVDVVISGHVHSYERTYPVTGNYTTTTNATIDRQDLNRYVNPRYPVHIISGAVGNGESVDDFSDYNWTFSAVKTLDHGYSSMTVHNKSCLSFDFLSITQGKVTDSFTISRDR